MSALSHLAKSYLGLSKRETLRSFSFWYLAGSFRGGGAFLGNDGFCARSVLCISFPGPCGSPRRAGIPALFTSLSRVLWSRGAVVWGVGGRAGMVCSVLFVNFKAGLPEVFLPDRFWAKIYLGIIHFIKFESKWGFFFLKNRMIGRKIEMDDSGCPLLFLLVSSWEMFLYNISFKWSSHFSEEARPWAPEGTGESAGCGQRNSAPGTVPSTH